jgi:hypothetical protein
MPIQRPLAGLGGKWENSDISAVGNAPQCPGWVMARYPSKATLVKARLLENNLAGLTLERMLTLRQIALRNLIARQT